MHHQSVAVVHDTTEINDDDYWRFLNALRNVPGPPRQIDVAVRTAKIWEAMRSVLVGIRFVRRQHLHFVFHPAANVMCILVREFMTGTIPFTSLCLAQTEDVTACPVCPRGGSSLS
jgi:hypothetical protein